MKKELLRLPVPLYILLSLFDLVFSLHFFAQGVLEWNPFLAWFKALGIFVPAKIVLIVVIAGGLRYVYSYDKKYCWVVWLAVAIMLAVIIYHFWGFIILYSSAKGIWRTFILYS